jgi:hypothetical protein
VALQRRFRRLRIGEVRQELRGGGARVEEHLVHQIWENALAERLCHSDLQFCRRLDLRFTNGSNRPVKFSLFVSASLQEKYKAAREISCSSQLCVFD